MSFREMNLQVGEKILILVRIFPLFFKGLLGFYLENVRNHGNEADYMPQNKHQVNSIYHQLRSCK